MFRFIVITSPKLVAIAIAAFFVCAFTALAQAALPTTVYISPSSGSTPPDTSKIFTCQYRDSDGWSNFQEASLLISSSSTALTSSVYLYYDQNSNLLYVRDDANAAWLGGFAPGSSNIIENSQVRLYCSSTTVTGSSSYLTVKWSISFKPAYSGRAYNIYLYAKDDTGGYVNWTNKGTYTVNRTPKVGTVAPASGNGAINTPAVFSAAYSDDDGWQNIQLVYLQINSSTGGTACLYGYYDQNANKLYLRDDNNTAWLGGYAPGSANVIENSYARLNCAATSISGSGTSLTVSWSVLFKSIFTGSKRIYLYVKDDVNAYAGWTQVGTWTMPNNPPQAGALTPTAGTSMPDEAVTFTTLYTDLDGWRNIQTAYFLINTYANGAACFYGYYNPMTNKLYLKSDANVSWLGGYAPGSSNVIENSYAKIDCSKTLVTTSESGLSISWKVTFKNMFSARTNTCYLYVADNAGQYQGYVAKGTWTIPSPNPQHKIPLEAESGTIISPVTKEQDSSASAGEYIQIANGAGTNNTSPGGPGIASFTFTVPVEDTYCIWGRGIAPSSSDNTFFVQADAGTVYSWSMPVSSSWTWAQAKDDTKGTVYIRLTPGTHTFYLRQREDGVKLDKVILVNDPLFTPGPIDVSPADPIAPTGSVIIGNGDPFTNTAAVTLMLSAQDNPGGSGLDAMQLSNDGVAWSAVEPFAASKAWDIGAGEGTKTVYVKFSDKAGNWSTRYVDSIVLDTTPPSVTITINDGEQTTDLFSVRIYLSVTDALYGMVQGAQMQFSNDGTAWSPPEDYSADKTWDLAPGYGDKTAYARCKDAAGNWSETASDTIEVVNVPKERIFIYLNGQRVAMEENGRRYFYHNDHLGGTNIVTDEAGRQVTFIDYQPFGETKTEEGGLNVKKKFTGKELDDSTGLYDYAARMYDPKLGRFISADIAQPDLTNPQSLNRYSYCLNNPLKYIDPTGHTVDYLTYDAYFLLQDIEAFQANPSFWNTTALGIDALLYAAPYIPAVAGLTTRWIQGLANIDDVARASSIADRAGDVGRAVAKGEEFVHVAPKAAKSSILKEGIMSSQDGYVYLSKEKHLENISLADLPKKIYKQAYQKIEAIKNRFIKGAIKIEVENIEKPKYHNRATKGGVPQWRHQGNIPPNKIKRIKEY